jgi:hypothetical protein
LLLDEKSLLNEAVAKKLSFPQNLHQMIFPPDIPNEDAIGLYPFN